MRDSGERGMGVEVRRDEGEGRKGGWRVDRLPLALRRLGILLCDAGVAWASLPLAFWLRYGAWDEVMAHMPPTAPWVFLPVFLIVARLSGLQRGIWRYTTLADLRTILQVATVSVVVFALVAFLLFRLEGVPRSLPFLQWGLLVLGLAGPRVFYRALREGEFGGIWREVPAHRRRPVLVIGIADHLPYLIRRLRRGKDPLEVVGLIATDRHHRRGQVLAGVPVLGALGDLERVVARLTRRRLRPKLAILTVTLPPAELDDLFERCRALDLPLRRSPDPRELRVADRDRLELRPVALEDLLERPQVHLDDEAVARMIRGRRVLVTGAGGSIGSELVRQILRHEPAALLALDRSEPALFELELELGRRAEAAVLRTVLCDVCDAAHVHAVFEDFRPDLVFHAAALKHVPMVERHPREGIRTNVLGTRHVADAAAAVGARGMVLISTDKAVNPASVMGATKRLAEFYCQMRDLETRRRGEGTRYVTVRFGNVLGSSGSVVTVFQRQLAHGGPLTVTHPEIVRFFMTIPEAVQLVLHASAFRLEREGEAGYIFVLDMGPPVRILDLARKMIRLAGRSERDVPIEIVGLRPGEKLYEELFDAEETRTPAPIDGVHLARPRPRDPVELERAIRLLEAAVRDLAPEDRLLELLERFVPGYRSSGKGEGGHTRDRPSGRLGS